MRQELGHLGIFPPPDATFRVHDGGGLKREGEVKLRVVVVYNLVMYMDGRHERERSVSRVNDMRERNARAVSRVFKGLSPRLQL